MHPATLNSHEKIQLLYNLLLCRQPDEPSWTNAAKSLESGERTYEEFVIGISWSPERKRLVGEAYFMKPVKPSFPASIIYQFLLKEKLSETSINLLTIELLIANGKIETALDLFKKLDNYNHVYESVRMVKLAQTTDYLRYIWIFRRLLFYRGPNQLVDLLPYTQLYYLNDDVIDNPKYRVSENLQNTMMLAEALSSNFIKAPYLGSELQMRAEINTAFNLIKFPDQIRDKCNQILNCIITQENQACENVPDNILLFVSGFTNSGSSAIYDWLRNSNQCSDVFSQFYSAYGYEKEIGLTQHIYGFPDLVKGLAEDTAEFKKRELNFFLWHVLGLYLPSNEIERFTKYYHIYVDAYCSSEDLFLKYLDIYLIFFRSFNYIYRNKSSELDSHIFLSLIAELCNLLQGQPRKYLLLNNAITCMTPEYLLMHAHTSLYVFTVRDPRDMYISWAAARPYTVEYFIDTFKNNLSKIYEFYIVHGNVYHLIPVSYEKFVFDLDYRRRLANKLKVERDLQSPYFKPEISMKRIGKWRNYSDQAAMQQIYDAFPEIYDGSYIRQFRENIEDC